MAEEQKPSQPTPSPSPKPAASSPSPSGGAASPSALPAEYAGKSAEEIYSTLSDRYKDYDSVRERASRFDKVKEYGYEDPDQVKALRDWAAQIANATYSGKAVVWDSKANQYRVMDMPSAAPSASAAPEDPYAGWDTLDDRQRGEKLGSLVQTRVMAEVEKIAKQYEQRFQQTFADLTTRNDLFLTLLEQKQLDPDLDVQNALDIAQKAGSLRGQDLIKWATDQARAPQQQKAQDEAIGKAIAEARAKWDSENNANAAPIMDTPRTWTPRGMKDDGGKMLTKEQENARLLSDFRQKGWIKRN